MIRTALIGAAAAGLLWAVPSVAAQPAADQGAALFDATCAACHNTGGIGTPGLAPPLDRPDFWQALGEDAPAYIAGVVTQGFNSRITVRGESYAGVMMMPLAGTPDAELASIATWVLATLGKTDHVVTPDDIARVRAQDPSNDELKALRPETE